MSDTVAQSGVGYSQMRMPLWLQPAEGDEDNVDLQYSAADFRQLIDAIYLTNGIVGTNSFKVTSNANVNMVDIAAGMAVIPSGVSGMANYLVRSSGLVEGLLIPASVGGTINYHRVVLEPLDRADNPDPAGLAPLAYGWRIRIIEWAGAAGAMPNAPVHSLTIARISRMGSGAVTITDYRKEALVGGGTGWTNFGTKYNSWEHFPDFTIARYRRTNDGMVSLDGMLRAGSTSSSGDKILSLPEGFCPADTTYIGVMSRTNGVLKSVRLTIQPNGDVTADTGEVDSTWVNLTDWISLAGVTFMAIGY